jgi:NifU-like protein involved in Fe-S cluster formation
MDITGLKPVRIVPANFGPLRDANANARFKGPCGDTMEFWLRIEGGRVLNATFTTDGCDHSLRCGSAAATLAVGKTTAEATAITQADVLAAAGSVPEDSQHCGLLASFTLKSAITGKSPS